MNPSPLPALIAAAALLTTGCIGLTDEDVDPASLTDELKAVTDLVQVTVDEVVTFEESVVDAATGYVGDLYEPTIDVSDTGTIYIAGHTILVDTTGPPAFFSTDDGATWEQLPFLGPAQMPAPAHSGAPPPSDEIFIVAGDDGWAYGVDITLFSFPVNAWSGDGAELAYHNPNAYNRVDSTTQCDPASVNDRPWAAYANGRLLMVNNAGNGNVQIGVLEVPPATPVGIGAPEVGPTWNTCASSGGFIPGIPAMRDDGLFMVPHVMDDDGKLAVVVGNADDVFGVEVLDAMPFTSAGSETVNFGHAVVDAEGQFFAGVVNNTREEVVCSDPLTELTSGGPCYDAVDGRFRLAAYDESTNTFHDRVFATDGVVRHMYMDGNIAGSGALVVWAIDGERENTADWFIGHVGVGDDGAPILSNVGLAIDEGPIPSAHVTGAALGPDGRAYLAMFNGGPLDEYAGSNPLSVFIQRDGPTLPVVGLE